MGIPNACCCGGVTCTIISALTAVDVADWTQVSGTWTNSGGSITTSSANALIVHDTPHPQSLSTGTMSVDITVAHTGVTRVLFAYLDTNNYIFFETEEDPADPTFFDDFIVRIGYRTAGVETILAELTTRVDFFGVALCYNGSRLSLEFTPKKTIAGGGTGAAEAFGLDAPLTGTWGTQIGIQVIGGTTDVTFDSVGFSGENSFGCSFCQGGCATCDDSSSGTNIPATPREVQVYFDNVANDNCADCVATFNGSTFLLSPYFPGTSDFTDRPCYFRNSVTLGGCFAGAADSITVLYGNGSGTTNELHLKTGGDDGVKFVSRTANRCDEVIADTGLTNNGIPQECDWSTADFEITPNVA